MSSKIFELIFISIIIISLLNNKLGVLGFWGFGVETIETDGVMLLISPLYSVYIYETLVYLVLTHYHLLGKSV